MHVVTHPASCADAGGDLVAGEGAGLGDHVVEVLRVAVADQQQVPAGRIREVAIAHLRIGRLHIGAARLVADEKLAQRRRIGVSPADERGQGEGEKKE